MTLSGATNLGQNGRGSNGNEEVLHISQSSRARTLPSDSLMSYPWHTLWVGALLLCKDAVIESYASADWSEYFINMEFSEFIFRNLRRIPVVRFCLA